MKKRNVLYLTITTFTMMSALFFTSCERDPNVLEPADYPVDPEVFIDGFSAGLNYAAFGGSKVTAFDVVNDIKYSGTSSMRIEVPDFEDPNGAYAGGAYFTSVGRNLSGFDALTFWAKSSQPANIDIVGIGNDLGESKNLATITGLAVNTNWKKYYIPIPDPSRFKAERGMFFYSEGPENNSGYTIWFDEVKFEKLGTIAHPQQSILNGQDQVLTSFVGVSTKIGGLVSVFNLPTGINQTVNVSPAYFNFVSSNESIATVDEFGNVLVVGGPGNAEITATMGDTEANGSLTVISKGVFEHAPTPTRDPANVISIYTEAYPNVPVDYYNGYWAPFQTTLSEDFTVDGDNILNYTNFNFVGIQFTSPTVNATSMTHLHLDIFIPNTLSANTQFKIEMVDFGTGGNVTGAFTTNILVSQSQQWISLDIPLSSFTGLSRRNNLAQIIFVDVNDRISSFYADNIYFYK
jgi:hypothetical protein